MLCFLICRFVLNNTHYRQQVQLHSLAGIIIRHQYIIALHHRLRSSIGRVQYPHYALFLVRPCMGEDPMLPRLQRQVLLSHRQLCLHCRMWWWKGRSTSDTCKAQPKWLQWSWFIPGQPCWRLQPTDDGWASSWKRRWGM